MISRNTDEFENRLNKIILLFLKNELIHEGNILKNISTYDVSTYDGKYKVFEIKYNTGPSNCRVNSKLITETISKYTGFIKQRDFWISVVFE
jgi:hypothetical protein